MTPSILQRIAGGETGAVRECLDHYKGLVWSIARRFSKRPSDAEDTTQEIFFEIWRHASRFDPSLGSEKTFIAMIARRRSIDLLRKISDEPPMDSSEEVLESLAWTEPGNTIEICDEAEQAMRAFEELRLEYRQVLELGCLHGLSQSAIATHLGLPLGTVKSFMRRGLMSIRMCLNKGGATPAAVTKPRRRRSGTREKCPVNLVISITGVVAFRVPPAGPIFPANGRAA